MFNTYNIMKHNEIKVPVYVAPEVKTELIHTEAGFCVSGTREELIEDNDYVW